MNLECLLEVMARRTERIMTLGLAVGVAAQGVLLWADSRLTFPEAIQYCTALICVVALVAELWRWRLHLNPHADMLLIMFSIGGAGMAFGGLGSSLSCHPTGWEAWSRMSGLMLGTGLLPSVPFSRCLQTARR